VVGGVDEDLVDDLEETGDEGDLAVDHALRLVVVGPHELGVGLDAADVGIGALEDVFDLRELGGWHELGDKHGEIARRTFVYFSDAVLFLPTGRGLSFAVDGPATSSSDASFALWSSASLLSTRIFFLGAALALPAVVALGFAAAFAGFAAALGFAGAFLVWMNDD
jgi:hypothetical protein